MDKALKSLMWLSFKWQANREKNPILYLVISIWVASVPKTDFSLFYGSF